MKAFEMFKNTPIVQDASEMTTTHASMTEELAPPPNHSGRRENQERLAPPPNQHGSQPTLLREQPTPPPNQHGSQPTLLQEEAGSVIDPSRTAPNTQNGNRPSPPPDSEEEPPPHPLDGTPLPNVWVYEGEAYDLTDFISKHPGGQFFIGRTKNRDITTIVNIFHRNPEKVKKMLKKYSLGRQAKPEDVHPKYNAPAFL